MTLASVSRAIAERASTFNRYMVGIAGAPGSGKSTFADRLMRELPNSVVVPMDGFHYDNVVLDELGLRARKGAPETFDYEGLATTLRRIRTREQRIAIPVFDRGSDLARAGAAIISVDTKYILVEGNYLLLDEAPWSGLSVYFDLSVFLNIPREVLQKRLLQRWSELGYSEERSDHWVMTNDMPNVDRVLGSRRKEDLCFDFAIESDI